MFNISGHEQLEGQILIVLEGEPGVEYSALLLRLRLALLRYSLLDDGNLFRALLHLRGLLTASSSLLLALGLGLSTATIHLYETVLITKIAAILKISDFCKF